MISQRMLDQLEEWLEQEIDIHDGNFAIEDIDARKMIEENETVFTALISSAKTNWLYNTDMNRWPRKEYDDEI